MKDVLKKVVKSGRIFWVAYFSFYNTKIYYSLYKYSLVKGRELLTPLVNTI